MKSSNQTGRTSSGPQKSKGPKTLTLIGMTVIVISIILMSVFLVSSFAGSNKRNPVVVFFGVTENFPKTSMTNTLHAAGFDYEIADENFEFDDDTEYVIAAVGDNALSVLSDNRDRANTLGFVLVNPKYPEGYTFEGLSSTYPVNDIAVFAGKDNVRFVSEMSDARIIYERLSGDDTLYGTPIKRGGLFASKCYINNAQNRYLSLSFAPAGSATSLLFSPLFQNELAGYLGVTYQNHTIRDVSFSRINTWFVVMLLAAFAFVFGEFIYLALLPVVMSDNVQGSIPAQEKISMGIVGGISLAFVVGIIALSLAENLHKYVILAMLFLPLLFMFIMALSRVSFIFKKVERSYKAKGRLIRPLFMAITSASALFLVSMAYGDLGIRYSLPESAVAAGCFMIASILSSILIFADRKSRSLQMGGCSFFGNAICLPMMVIPAVFAIAYGLVFKFYDITIAGVGGLLTVLVPYLFVIPLRRHTDNYLIPGLLYGFVYTVVFMLIA